MRHAQLYSGHLTNYRGELRNASRKSTERQFGLRGRSKSLMEITVNICFLELRDGRKGVILVVLRIYGRLDSDGIGDRINGNGKCHVRVVIN